MGILLSYIIMSYMKDCIHWTIIADIIVEYFRPVFKLHFAWRIATADSVRGGPHLSIQIDIIWMRYLIELHCVMRYMLFVSEHIPKWVEYPLPVDQISSFRDNHWPAECSGRSDRCCCCAVRHRKSWISQHPKLEQQTTMELLLRRWKCFDRTESSLKRKFQKWYKKIPKNVVKLLQISSFTNIIAKLYLFWERSSYRSRVKRDFFHIKWLWYTKLRNVEFLVFFSNERTMFYNENLPGFTRPWRDVCTSTRHLFAHCWAVFAAQRCHVSKRNIYNS